MTPPPLTTPVPSRRTILAVPLLLIGVQLWLLSDARLWRAEWSLLLDLAVIVAAFVPAVQRIVGRASAFLDQRNALRTTIAMVLIAALSSAWLFTCARQQHRVLEPTFHDEYSYRIQIEQLAHGRLWMPAHPLADSFESFYLITDRVYASQYFPGAAAMFVPAVWAHVPLWAWAIGLTGLTCAALYLLIRELFDSAAAIGATIAMLGCQSVRYLSLTTLSQVPALLLSIVLLAALARWSRVRESNGGALRWVVLAGVATGWLAITRPLDAAAFGFVGAGFVAWTLRRAAWPIWRATLLAGLLPLLPFAAVQVVADVGITGRPFETPFGYYLERDMPGTELGFHKVDPWNWPTSTLRQKQDFYASFVKPALVAHTPSGVLHEWFGNRTSGLVAASLPDTLLILFIPLGLAFTRDSRRWLVIAVLPAWCLLYSLHPFNLWHYGVAVIPCALTLALGGLTALGRLTRQEQGLAAWAVVPLRLLVPAALAIGAMPQARRDVRDQIYQNPVERTLADAIAANVGAGRAIVLVRYTHAGAPDAAAEVVFNSDVAWPDDACVIRAHDLDADRNARLYRYYAQRQPDRVVYRFDRVDGSMTRLGPVTDLADGRTNPSTSAPTTAP